MPQRVMIEEDVFKLVIDQLRRRIVIALDFAKSYLHYGREKNVSDLFRRIDEVTADRLQTVAQDLFNPDRLTTLILR